MSLVLPHLAPETSVLDIGCGEGWVADELCRRGWRHCGGRRRRRAPDAHAPFSLYDGVNLPFPDARFDVAMLNFVLHHVPDERKVALLREALRVARRRSSSWRTRRSTAFDRFVSRRHGEAYRRKIASDAPVRFPDPQRMDVAFPRHGRRADASRWAVLPIGAAAVRARRVRAPQGACGWWASFKFHRAQVMNRRRGRRSAGRCRGTSVRPRWRVGCYLVLQCTSHVPPMAKADAADICDADFAALIEAVYRAGGNDAEWLQRIVTTRSRGWIAGRGGRVPVRSRGRRNPGDDGGGRRGLTAGGPGGAGDHFSPRVCRARAGARAGTAYGIARAAAWARGARAVFRHRRRRRGAPRAGACRLRAAGAAAACRRAVARRRRRLVARRRAHRRRAAAASRRSRWGRIGGVLLSGRWTLVDHFDAGGRPVRHRPRQAAVRARPPIERLTGRERDACARAAAAAPTRSSRPTSAWRCRRWGCCCCARRASSTAGHVRS